MKVLHLTSYYGGDGAAHAVLRLHQGLLRLGHDSTLLVAERHTDESDQTVRVFTPSRDLRSRLRRRLRRVQIARDHRRYVASRPAGCETFSDDRSLYGADLIAQVPPCDIVHLHAMLNFVDYRAFFAAVPRRTPVVRTLHDMSFFTGGCHYDAGCGRYADRCGACPQLGSHHEHDLSRQIWQRKRAAYGAVPPNRLYLVTASRWLAAEAARSSLLGGFPIAVIPYGLDLENFRPRDRRAAREVLGIPQDAGVVLFVAQPITRAMKGFALLAEALRLCSDLTNVLLVSVGSGKAPVDVAVPHLRLGHIGHQRMLSLAYSAADVFAMPSLQEAFGQTALEATACGTPVVGFAAGGIPDIVRPGVTGLLVPVGDAAALGAAVRELLRDPARRAEMAANCRRLAVEEYGLELQAVRYAALYERILAEERPRGADLRLAARDGGAWPGGRWPYAGRDVASPGATAHLSS
jgi:glycosyltransferase involved in cell wall biosynthesis